MHNGNPYDNGYQSPRYPPRNFPDMAPITFRPLNTYEFQVLLKAVEAYASHETDPEKINRLLELFLETSRSIGQPNN